MFEKLTGNEQAKDNLRRILQAQRTPGALILAGESGVGKKMFAIEIAKSLNCLSPTAGGEACDMCAACLRIARLVALSEQKEPEKGENIFWSEHPDVGLVRAMGTIIKIDQIRELERETNFRPYEGRARVFIIDEAERMNEQASNALLKTLEEMPATSHVVLITARLDALLPTVRSRCQIVRFAPLSADEIEKHLTQHRKPPLPSDKIKLLARVARGSLSRALSLDAETYRTKRAPLVDAIAALAGEMGKMDRARLLRVAEELSDPKRKDEYESALDALEILVRDVWLLSLSNNNAIEITNADIRDKLAPLAARTPSRRAARWLTQIEDVRRTLAVNINRRVATDALFLSMGDE
jgi:DNA polymerase III subunit delta'